MIYAIFPGTIVDDNGQTVTYTYEELIALYNVDEEDCVLGTSVPQSQLMRYILLKPRPDGMYDDMAAKVGLGDTYMWGPDFDGTKRYTQETDYETMYSEEENEELP